MLLIFLHRFRAAEASSSQALGDVRRGRKAPPQLPLVRLLVEVPELSFLLLALLLDVEVASSGQGLEEAGQRLGGVAGEGRRGSRGSGRSSGSVSFVSVIGGVVVEGAGPDPRPAARRVRAGPAGRPLSLSARMAPSSAEAASAAREGEGERRAGGAADDGDEEVAETSRLRLLEPCLVDVAACSWRVCLISLCVIGVKSECEGAFLSRSKRSREGRRSGREGDVLMLKRKEGVEQRDL